MNNNIYDKVCKNIAIKNNMGVGETEDIIRQYIIHQRDKMLEEHPKVVIKGVGTFIRLKDGKEYYEEVVRKREERVAKRNAQKGTE